MGRKTFAYEITYLTVDELEVTRALGITVTSTVLSTSLVVLVFRQTAISVHGDEVQSAIQAAGKAGNIHVKGKLLVQQLEHLVGVVVLHEIQAGTDVGAGHKAQGQGIARSSGTVGASVVGTIESAVSSASGIVGAKSGIPLFIQIRMVSYGESRARDDKAYRVTSVAVGVAVNRVNPAPIGIHDNGAALIRAARGGALLPGKSRMGLCLLCASLLGTNTCHQGREKECALMHLETIEGLNSLSVDFSFCLCSSSHCPAVAEQN